MHNDERMDEVKRLISMGKNRGFITYDELNDLLPAEVISADQIDDIMMAFGEEEIEVLDVSPEALAVRNLYRSDTSDRSDPYGIATATPDTITTSSVRACSVAGRLLCCTAAVS